jgi:hypothetical protein
MNARGQQRKKPGRKRGRQKVSISVTLLPRHKAFLEEEAARKGLSVSEYLRLILEEEMRKSLLEDDIWLYFTPEGDFDENTLLPKTEGGLAKALWIDIARLLDDYGLKRTVVEAYRDYQLYAKRSGDEPKEEKFLDFLLRSFQDALRGTVLLPYEMDIETAKAYALQNIKKAHSLIERLTTANPELVELERDMQRLEDEEK